MIQSTSWEGTLTLNNINSFQLNGEETNTFGVQLNTVTTNTTVFGNTSGSFWTQDVFFYEPAIDTAFFLDNIWNFSNPSTAEPASTFYSYNGTPVAPVFYYDETVPMYLALPFTLHLYMNTSTTINATSGLGYPTVRFGANIVNATGHSIYHGVFDTVLFNAHMRAAFVPLTKFMVNGAKLTPTNFLLYDSEIMIGGPGGGTTASIYAVNGSENLRYLNGVSGTVPERPDRVERGVGHRRDLGRDRGVLYERRGTVSLSGGP